MPAKQPIRRLQILNATPSRDGTIDSLRITLRDQFGSQEEVEIPRSCAASWKALATVLKAKTRCQIDRPAGYIPGLPDSAQCSAANMSGRTLPPLAFAPVALTPTTTVPSAMPGVDLAAAKTAAAHAVQIGETAVRAHQAGATTSAQVHALRRQELLAATASGRAVLDKEAADRRGK